ncbi:MAG TPA: NifU family protein, partial [Gemmatimonadaceae bacterium]|nr:NifU family protein [Gemmatimonadaceae bacterium]
QAHGRRGELVDVTGDVARVRLARDGHGCASTSRTVRGTIEEAVLRAAPELSRVELEETDGATPALVTLAGPRRNNSQTRASDARSVDAPDAVSPRAP